MTNESKHNDPHVSEAYRRLATETTPPELDRRILALAAGRSRSPYGLARLWIRPVAWAATIGLSLAIMLEISQLRHESVPRSDAAEALSIPATRQPNSPPPSGNLRRDADPEPSGDALSVADEFIADDMSLMQEAEEQARARSGSEKGSATPAETRSFAAASRLEKKATVKHCDADARSTPESWYRCIEKLQDQGLAEAAGDELALLLAEFPEFEETIKNR